MNQTRYVSIGTAVAISAQFFILVLLLTSPLAKPIFALKWMFVTRIIQTLLSAAMVFIVLYVQSDTALSYCLEALAMNRLVLAADTTYVAVRLFRREWSGTAFQTLIVLGVYSARFAQFDDAVLFILSYSNLLAAFAYQTQCVGDLACLHVLLAFSLSIEHLTTYSIGCYMRSTVMVFFGIWVHKHYKPEK